MDDFIALRIAGATLDDAMHARISINNRITRVAKANPDFVTDRELWFGDAVEQMLGIESMITKVMQKTLKRAAPDVYEFVKETNGLGLPSIARLIGVIGDPAVASPSHWEPNPAFDDEKPSSVENPKRLLVTDPVRPRTVSQLWSYAGYGDPARKRTRGMTVEDAMALGNPQAKSLLHIIVASTVRAGGTAGGSLYADHYNRVRLQYRDKVGEDGVPWTLGHQQAAAYRNTAKEILRDLWLLRTGELPRYGQKITLALA